MSASVSYFKIAFIFGYVQKIKLWYVTSETVFEKKKIHKYFKKVSQSENSIWLETNIQNTESLQKIDSCYFCFCGIFFTEIALTLFLNSSYYFLEIVLIAIRRVLKPMLENLLSYWSRFNLLDDESLDFIMLSAPFVYIISFPLSSINIDIRFLSLVKGKVYLTL